MCSIESMRNGNSTQSMQSLFPQSVQSNLWGMETFPPRWTPRQCGGVQSNLWGMETLEPSWYHTLLNSGSIESMRNGNRTQFAQTLFHEVVQSNLWGMETSFARCVSKTHVQVQSNLWGMETKTHDTRNSCDRGCSIESMRNGNKLLSSRSWLYKRKFNRIYEEWKLLNTNAHGFNIGMFNRIYEEWKPTRHACQVTGSKRFNRIYEEWKRARINFLLFHFSCSIESMRNGNAGRRR